MFHSIISLTFATLLLGCIVGCIEGPATGGSGVGNPPQGTVTFSMQATSGMPPLPKSSAGPLGLPDSAFTVTDAGGTTFTIRSSLANVGYVEIKLPDGQECTEAIDRDCEMDEVKLPGPFVANLMTGAFQPDIGTFRIPAGSYKRVEFRLEALKEGAPTPEPSLLGNSMIITGTFSYAGRADRAFSIALDFDEELRVESPTGMTVRDQGLSKLVLLLEVEKWMATADITRCLEEGELLLDQAGNLVANEENDCEGLEEVLKSGVKGSGELDEEFEGTSEKEGD